MPRPRRSVSERACSPALPRRRLKDRSSTAGSFDPIHHGHLILAREALETLDLAEVIFVLAAQSPHKALTRPTSAAVRWEMLTAAITGERCFSASRLEIDRPPPSYSDRHRGTAAGGEIRREIFLSHRRGQPAAAAELASL